MSRLGKIILDNNYANPRIIIADANSLPRAIELVKYNDSTKYIKIDEDDIVNLGYKGRKMNGRYANLSRVITVSNLNVREIGSLTEDAYYRVLRGFVCYQTAIGADSIAYLSVRDEVQSQLIKKMK